MENFKCVTKQINEYFKDNIKFLFVSKCNVIIVTKKDHVYEIDRKSNIIYLIGSRKVTDGY
jgi:CO dehydrogenase/acetyl-CoA synthase beta subunit